MVVIRHKSILQLVSIESRLGYSSGYVLLLLLARMHLFFKHGVYFTYC